MYVLRKVLSGSVKVKNLGLVFHIIISDHFCHICFSKVQYRYLLFCPSIVIEIILRAAPFNITIIQVYAPTSGHDESEVDHFYQQLQETIDKTQKKDILVVQGDWKF